MSSPLCLDLEKYAADEHSCGCLVVCPLAEATETLGLHLRKPTKDSRGAMGIAHYTVRGQRYSIRILLHTREKHPDSCCLHMNYELIAEDVVAPSANLSVGVAKLDSGLSELFASCASSQRRAQSDVQLDGDAPVVSALAVPAAWPKGARVSGVHLSEPNGKAGAIVQEISDNKVAIVVYIEGGSGLSPRQIRSGFLSTVRLAESFRDGTWDVTERGVQAYEKL